MLFNSYEFLFVFLPLTLVGYFAFGRLGVRAAATFLGLASLGFYAWWRVEFLPTLALSILFNYSAGILIDRWRACSFGRAMLISAIAANLGALAFYKYAGFLAASANAFGAHLQLLDIILPIGISFFTFTQIAFLVDVWRGKAQERHFINYILFVSYFPHLIAGPMLHHAQIMPQFSNPDAYRLKSSNLALGIAIFIIGLVKKVLIADPLSIYASGVFNRLDTGAEPDMITAWCGALAFTLQIYFDFSGYSDMAIGASKMFGIDLPINFNSPYKATSIIDFWRRWHMSLSQFLRDYLYIPLGGNQKGPARRYINLMLTMLLGGLWHGANWTFVVWGGLHGLYLVINHLWRSTLPSPPKALAWMLTTLAVVIAWVFFRASDFDQALIVLRGMAGMNGLGSTILQIGGQKIGELRNVLPILLIAGALCALPNSQSLARQFEAVLQTGDGAVHIFGIKLTPRALTRSLFVSATIAAAFFFTCVGFIGGKSEFLYFQF